MLYEYNFHFSVHNTLLFLQHNGLVWVGAGPEVLFQPADQRAEARLGRHERLPGAGHQVNNLVNHR